MDDFDRLHVISDLHLGGAPGREIFTQGPALAGFVDWARAHEPERRVGLVLGGDIIDFLALPGARYLATRDAVERLDEVLEDPQLAPVWAALGAFLRTEGRVLVLLLGNHDVELALPDAQDRLLEALCGEQSAARGRVRVAMDGTGYRCRVGGERVLCVHGNDMDAWNVVDQAALRKVALAQRAGAEPPEWTPNGGTRLVVDVINPIKRRYPFVDLLKPETKPVLDVLLALPRDYELSAGSALAAYGRRLYDDGRRRAGFLGPGDAGEAVAIAAAGGAPSRIEQAPAPSARALLAEASADFAAGRRPDDPAVVGAGAGEQTLGFFGLLTDLATGAPSDENLREALARHLRDDRTFTLDRDDDPAFTHLDREAGRDVRFLVAGHTHLERRLERRQGEGVFFNSGTWIRIMRIAAADLADDASFARLRAALESSDAAALEPWVDQRNTVVTIAAGATGATGATGEVRGVLQRVPVGASTGAQARPEDVVGSEYVCRRRSPR